MGVSIELNRLLCAALVSQSFREKLLVNPEAALSEGYSLGSFGTEMFDLTDEEKQVVLSIKAKSLQELASQIAQIYTPPKSAAPTPSSYLIKNSLNGHSNPVVHTNGVHTNGNGKH